jgi:hypothetical protein
MWIHPNTREPLEKFPDNQLLLTMLARHLPPRQICDVRPSPTSSLIKRLKEKQIPRKDISIRSATKSGERIGPPTPDIIPEDLLRVLYSASRETAWVEDCSRRDGVLCELDGIPIASLVGLTDSEIHETLLDQINNIRSDYVCVIQTNNTGDVDRETREEPEETFSNVHLHPESIADIIRNVRALETMMANDNTN